MPECDAEHHNFEAMLGSPQDWALSGEGAANVVFTYTGHQPDLVRITPPPSRRALTTSPEIAANSGSELSPNDPLAGRQGVAHQEAKESGDAARSGAHSS